MRPQIVTSLISLLSFAATIPAQGVTVGAVADMAMDTSCRIVASKPLARGDLRDNIALFGQRPTLVVFPAQVKWMKTKAKDYVRAFKKADKYVSKWRRQGLDIVLVIPRARIWKAGSKSIYEFDFAKKVKAKHCTAVEIEWQAVPERGDTIVSDLLIHTGKTPELELRWAFISKLGVIQNAGDNLYGKQLKAQIKEVRLPQVAKNPATKKIFEAINQWRLSDAVTLITKMKKGPAGEQNMQPLQELEEMIDAAETHYQELYANRNKARGYLPEYSESLSTLANRYLGGSSRGDVLLASIKELKASEKFVQVEAQRKAYKALESAFETAETKVDKAYSKANGKRNYNEFLYSQKLVEIYPPVVEAMRQFVRDQRGSPYYKEGALLLMDTQETLAYSKQVVARGQ